MEHRALKPDARAAAIGFVPPNARLEEGVVFQTVDYVVRRIPEAPLRNRKQSWFTHDEWLNSPGAAVARHLITSSKLASNVGAPAGLQTTGSLTPNDSFGGSCGASFNESDSSGRLGNRLASVMFFDRWR